MQVWIMQEMNSKVYNDFHQKPPKQGIMGQHGWKNHEYHRVMNTPDMDIPAIFWEGEFTPSPESQIPTQKNTQNTKKLKMHQI